MGEYLTTYNVQTEKGVVIFTGTIKQISSYFNTTEKIIYTCYYSGKQYLHKYWIVPVTVDYDTNISPDKIHDHLWTEDGKRCYDRRQGYPNRYKDSSGRRFTPL